MSGYGLDERAQFAVTQVFQLSEVSNPGTMDGINLHIQIDESIFHASTVSLPGAYEFKDYHFGTENERSDANSANILAAKKQVYHYGHMIDKFDGSGQTSERSSLCTSTLVS